MCVLPLTRYNETDDNPQSPHQPLSNQLTDEIFVPLPDEAPSISVVEQAWVIATTLWEAGPAGELHSESSTDSF